MIKCHKAQSVNNKVSKVAINKIYADNNKRKNVFQIPSTTPTLDHRASRYLLIYIFIFFDEKTCSWQKCM